MLRNKYLHFWIFCIAILAGLTLPRLVKDGLFMDGLFYAAVAKNLSEGMGSFWYPHFSPTLHSFFDHQPPLGIWIQSLFFHAFGNSIYTERIYSFFCCIITALLIIVLWNKIYSENSENKKFGWLPIIIWITIPICFYSYANNLLENTMVVFDLLAVYFIYNYLQNRSVTHLFFSGLFTLLAFLTKGFQGLFPIATLLLGWLIYRKDLLINNIKASTLHLLFIIGMGILILLNKDAYTNITAYLDHRVVPAITKVETSDHRLYLWYRLFCIELAPSLMFSFLLLFFTKKKIKTNYPNNPIVHNKHFMFFFLIGLSASLPLIMARDQKGFYLVTSFPFFAIAIASLILPNIKYLVNKTDKNSNAHILTGSISVISLVGVLFYSFLQFGKTGRDADTIHDVHLIGSVVPNGTILGSTQELWKKWSLQEYLIRHYYIAQDHIIKPENNYLLLENKNAIPGNIKAEKINIPTRKYHLYRIVK